jgi:hypothetical protein
MKTCPHPTHDVSKTLKTSDYTLAGENQKHCSHNNVTALPFLRIVDLDGTRVVCYPRIFAKEILPTALLLKKINENH